jgi:hypothetical protein
MTTTLPPPPTDGSHPHAQPVHYARPNAYTNTASAWQEEFRLLLLEVAHSPGLRREIDRGAPAEDSTSATRREFEDVMRAQEALQQARRAGKKIVAQNTVPLEKPGAVPSPKRAKSYEPTGNPRGRPKGDGVPKPRKPRKSRASKGGMDARPCTICREWFSPTTHTAKGCSPACREVVHKIAKAKHNKARTEKERVARQAEKANATLACADCGEVVQRTSPRQERCSPCAVDLAKKRNAQWYKAHAQRTGTAPVAAPCSHCGVMMPPATTRKRYCSDECYGRWFRAQAKAKKQASEDKA